MYRYCGFLVAFALLLACTPAVAKSDDNMKTGIVIAAFGTTIPEARKDYGIIDKAVKAKYPGVPVEWGYTAKQVRQKVRAEQNMDAPSVEQALARLSERGVERVAVLTLLMIPGEEHRDVVKICESMTGLPKGLEAVSVSAPLISGAAEAKELAAALTKEFASAKGGVLFVGHGSPHSGGSLAYAALAHYLAGVNDRFQIGVIEGEPGTDAAFAAFKNQKQKNVTLVPLLIVAGDHARNDIAGSEPDSLASRFKKEGMSVDVKLQGLPRIQDVTGMWLERLDAAMRNLND